MTLKCKTPWLGAIHILTSDDDLLLDQLPPYIDRYPDEISDKIDIISARLTTAQKIAKDLNVRNTIHSLRKDIVVIKGVWSSVLTPSVVYQRSRFLKEMGHSMDVGTLHVIYLYCFCSGRIWQEARM
jgi:hypothetical protein